jgi:hypothetical protein
MNLLRKLLTLASPKVVPAVSHYARHILSGLFWFQHRQKLELQVTYVD